MKQRFILTIMAIALAVCSASAKIYKITEVKGEVKANGYVLKRGNTIKDTDQLEASRPSEIQLTDTKTSFTLTVRGSGKTVKQLIAALPGKYGAAARSLQKNLSRTAVAPNIEYGMVTMAHEIQSEFGLEDGEAVAMCKEDSLGNLVVTFIRFGMEKPIRYKVQAQSYNYLLRANIITSKGSDFAYSTTAVFDTLWKPLEQYLQPDDILYYTMVPYLADIDMSRIKADSGATMGDLYILIALDE